MLFQVKTLAYEAHKISIGPKNIELPVWYNIRVETRTWITWIDYRNKTVNYLQQTLIIIYSYIRTYFSYRFLNASITIVIDIDFI